MKTRSAPIGEVCAVVGGGTPARNVAEYYGGSIPWVSPKDMKTWEIRDAQVNITESGLQNSATRLVPRNSVLVVVRSGVLKHTLPVAINRVPVAINQDMKALLCSESADPDYVARFIKARSPVILQWVRATTADNFPIDKLKCLELPLPPLPEQRRIAAILDKADELRAKRRAAIVKLDILTQSIFLDMFGDPATNPNGWPTITLKQALTTPLRNGLSPSKTGKVSAQVLTLSAITGSAFNDAAWKVSTFLSSPPADQSVASQDFLICRGNGNIQLVGRGQFPTRSMPEVTFPDTMIAARVSDQLIEPAFLQHVWNSRAVRQQIESLARTTNGTFKVNQTMLEGITFISPPVPLQRQFSYRATVIEEAKKKECESLAGLDALFSVLQHRAFRGEL